VREGTRVSFCGDIEPGSPEIGDVGKVIADAGSHGHIMWSTGARSGQTDFLPYDAVVPAPTGRVTTAAVDVSDTLAFGPMMTVAVRATYEESGPAGLLAALHEGGHLAGLVDVAEHAVVAVTSQIRTDETLAPVLAQLDEGEREQFLATTTLALLREAFGGDDPDAV
jgi:hypothetical protein